VGKKRDFAKKKGQEVTHYKKLPGGRWWGKKKPKERGDE